MANISDAKVRLYFRDVNGCLIPVDLDKPEYTNFKALFTQMSYDTDGSYLGDNMFIMFGRWTFESNFQWTEEVSAYLEELQAVNPDIDKLWILCRDTDFGDSWIEAYWMVLDVKTGVYNKLPLISFDVEEFANYAGVTEEQMDDEGSRYTFLDATLTLFDNMVFNPVDRGRVAPRGVTVFDLSREQMTQLKQSYYCERNENVSWGELAEIDSLVTDKEIQEAYFDTWFSEDDFTKESEEK